MLEENLYDKDKISCSKEEFKEEAKLKGIPVKKQLHRKPLRLERQLAIELAEKKKTKVLHSITEMLTFINLTNIMKKDMETNPDAVIIVAGIAANPDVIIYKGFFELLKDDPQAEEFYLNVNIKTGELKIHPKM